MIMLLASLLLHLPQFDGQYYQLCMATGGTGQAGCCQQSNGRMVGDKCVDPADIITPPTVTVTTTMLVPGP